MEEPNQLGAAISTIAAARDFCKSLITLSATVLGVYATLLSWALPRGAASAPGVRVGAQTALCLALPLLDVALGIVAFSLGYFGAGADRDFAPATFDRMSRFHERQLRWIRTGSIFVLGGLLSGFSMVGRFLLPLSATSAVYFEYFAAAASLPIALVALIRVATGNYRIGLYLVVFVLGSIGVGVLIGGKLGMAIGAVLGCLPLVAAIAIGAALVAAIMNPKS